MIIRKYIGHVILHYKLFILFFEITIIFRKYVFIAFSTNPSKSKILLGLVIYFKLINMYFKTIKNVFSNNYCYFKKIK